MSSSSVTIRCCTGCDRPIPAKRLAAKPNARLCVVCQSSTDVVYREPAVPLSFLDHVTGGQHSEYKRSELRDLAARGLLSTSGLSGWQAAA